MLHLEYYHLQLTFVNIVTRETFLSESVGLVPARKLSSPFPIPLDSPGRKPAGVEPHCFSGTSARGHEVKPGHDIKGKHAVVAPHWGHHPSLGMTGYETGHRKPSEPATATADEL
jgi:hypothetical protein